jgi:hypothetical protein
MNIFSIPQAQYFCSNFQGSQGDAENSLSNFCLGRINRPQIINEGTALFIELRDCIIREIERNIFLAVSNYRRCLDMMIDSASHWALVTIYYSNFYSAKSLLGIFGCTILNQMVIDVNNGNPGQQELRIRRNNNNLSTYTGSHRRFWDLFYQAVTPLRPIIRGNQNVCLNPISSNPAWLIESRNDINYDSWQSLNLSRDFAQNFDKTSFPNSLPGIIRTQYGYLESLLELVFYFVTTFQLTSDSLRSLYGLNDLRQNISDHIYNKKAPGLIRKTNRNILI